MARSPFSHVVGFDDAPFSRDHRGNVPVVGAVFARLRLEGVLCGRVRRDGANATDNLARLVATSKFARQLQLVMLQGIALAGFNVIDIAALHRALDLPILVVVRRRPRLDKVRSALLARVPRGPLDGATHVGGRRRCRGLEPAPVFDVRHGPARREKRRHGQQGVILGQRHPSAPMNVDDERRPSRPVAGHVDVQSLAGAGAEV